MKDPVPGKRRLLTQLALLWFDKLHALVPKHLTGESPDIELAAQGQQRTAAAERALLSGTALQRERVLLNSVGSVNVQGDKVRIELAAR